jgi:hypothetical protein
MPASRLPSPQVGGWWEAGFFACATDRDILSAFSALSFVTATHQQIAIVSTKFATILRPNEQLSSEISSETGSVQHGAGADRRRGSKGPRVLGPKQLTFL